MTEAQQMAQRMDDLTRQIIQQSDTIALQSQQMMQHNAHAVDQQSQMTQLRTDMATAAAAAQSQHDDGPIIPNGAVPKPKNFSGEHKDYMNFHDAFMAWIGCVHPELPGLLEHAESRDIEMDHTGYDTRTAKISVTLFAMLHGFCIESSSEFKGVDGNNGFEVWRRLYRLRQPNTGMKSQAWRRRLMNPEFPRDEKSWSKAFHEWESEIKKYEREHVAIIDPADRHWILVDVAPQAMKQHLALNAHTLSTYDALKKCIEDYLASKNLWERPEGAKFGGGDSTKRKVGKDDMDIGGVGDKGQKGKDGKHKKGNSKGDKDKGKGKGEGDKGKGDKGKNGKGKDKDKSKTDTSVDEKSGKPWCENCAKCHLGRCWPLQQSQWSQHRSAVGGVDGASSEASTAFTPGAGVAGPGQYMNCLGSK